MKYTRLILVFILTFYLSSLEAKSFSQITNIQSFQALYKDLDSIDSDTLVIFDIDDVLITYEDMVLRPCASDFRPKSWKGIDPKKIPTLVSIMLTSSEIRLIESEIVARIHGLQEKGIKIIALTAARTGKFGIIENAEDWRIITLKKLGIDFSKAFPEVKTLYFDKKEQAYSLFKEGILFLGDTNCTKGELLSLFLEAIKHKPKKLIFVDDKYSNLISVQKALKTTNIAFHGYLYEGVGNLGGEFDERIGEKQLSFLRKNYKWLSDDAIIEKEADQP